MKYPEVDKLRKTLTNYNNQFPYIQEAVGYFHPMSVSTARKQLAERYIRIRVPSNSLAFVIPTQFMFAVSTDYNKLSSYGRMRVAVHEFAHMYVAVERYHNNLAQLIESHNDVWKNYFKAFGKIMGMPPDEIYYDEVYYGDIHDVDSDAYRHYIANYYCPECKNIFKMTSDEFKEKHSHNGD